MPPLYRQSEDIVTRQIAGETMLVPVRGDLAGLENLFVLRNPVAVYIWQRLAVGASLETIRDGLLARFEVGVEQAESDVCEFLAQLLQAGLVVEVA